MGEIYHNVNTGHHKKLILMGLIVFIRICICRDIYSFLE